MKKFAMMLCMAFGMVGAVAASEVVITSPSYNECKGGYQWTSNWNSTDNVYWPAISGTVDDLGGVYDCKVNIVVYEMSGAPGIIAESNDVFMTISCGTGSWSTTLWDFVGAGTDGITAAEDLDYGPGTSVSIRVVVKIYIKATSTSEWEYLSEDDFFGRF
jgi:hypothetical protein